MCGRPCDFGTIGGKVRGNIAALDAVSGQALPWNGTISSVEATPVLALAMSGSTLYVGGGLATDWAGPALANSSTLAVLDSTL